MTDDCDGAGIDNLLGRQRAFLRISFVVFSNQIQLVRLVAYFQTTGGVDLLDG